MPTLLHIDFVSDVSCPWCAIGLGALEQALQRLAPDIGADIHFQPFELNPAMPPGGQDMGEHLHQKYGSTPAQQEAAREMIRQRGAEVGFEFRLDRRSRIYNTFDAHRLLHWAAEEGPPPAQRALKKALLRAYFTQGLSPESHAVLCQAAAEAGLDAARAAEVLSGDAWAQAVRQQQRRWLQAGIQAVPGVVINQRHLISGGQPPEVFEQVLRRLAAQEPAPA
ncbi:MAG: DsbA family oxidoreductase [Rhodoferax sp.]|nr:DsbA family oxidoreductase [Rhodoferax sp.]